ncbi:MAG TPA: S8 family peptidase [Candidatus Eremiobacteraeota bacterium]|nr:MAG: Serine protease AprX [bacterium ADurb.Bin363]HPZ06942.1 S8 family peptidase [Candidatus Eremiobacteraeota bacterium]
MDIRKSGENFVESRVWSGHAGKISEKQESLSKDRVELNSSSKDSVDTISDYLIIPRPSRMAMTDNKEESFALTTKDLEKREVKIEDKIPLVTGYTAKLNQGQKKELEKAGYIVYEDKVEQWIPEPDIEEILEKSEEPLLDNAMKSIRKEPSGIQGTEDPIFTKYTGKGVGIAIIDTGVYPHPDITTPQNPDPNRPLNKITAWVDFVNNRSVPYDDGGHGTHVAGDAAGSGTLSDGKYRAFAPDANIIGLKVLGTSGGKTSHVVKAINWAVENKDKYNIKVINMSLGHKAQHYAEDPTDIAVEAAVKAGITVVVAGGNDGPEPGTICAPGDSPFAITVGAIDDKNTPDRSDDTLTPFSSRGPTPDGLVKPDILAPGENIIAPLAPGSKAEGDGKFMQDRLSALNWLKTFPDEQLMAIPDEILKKLYGFKEESIKEFKKSPEDAKKLIDKRIQIFSRMPLVMGTAYMGMPGTSMATPIVSGVVAAMYEANPDLTPYQVKQILMSTADKLPGLSDNEQGAGYLDAKEAIHKAEEMKISMDNNKIFEG